MLRSRRAHVGRRFSESSLQGVVRYLQPGSSRHIDVESAAAVEAARRHEIEGKTVTRNVGIELGHYSIDHGTQIDGGVPSIAHVFTRRDPDIRGGITVCVDS